MPELAAQHGVFAGQPGSGQTPFNGAVIQQQQPPQSVYAALHALGLHSAVHMSVLLVPAVELDPPDAVPAVPPLLVPALAVVPALVVLDPPLESPPPPPLPLSELHAASPTVDDAPVTTST